MQSHQIQNDGTPVPETSTSCKYFRFDKLLFKAVYELGSRQWNFKLFYRQVSGSSNLLYIFVPDFRMSSPRAFSDIVHIRKFFKTV